MLNEVEETMAWLQDPIKCWNECQLALEKFSGEAEILVEKVDDDKLARDVDDLSAIFEGLVDGVDLSVPFQDLGKSFEATDAWIDQVESDVVNINELSEAFDVLVAEQAEEEESEEEYDEDEEMEEEENELERSWSPSGRVIPSPPVWASSVALDPRSCIRTPVFKNMDSRIPQIAIPRIDMAFGGERVQLAQSEKIASRVRSSLSPKRDSEKTTSAAYQHNPSTCWICKSDKSAYKKHALHRFLEKRSRRNWKRGPRYSGRSHVATARVRNGGRFICTTQWI